MKKIYANYKIRKCDSMLKHDEDDQHDKVYFYHLTYIIVKAMDQSDHATKLYINSFMLDKFLNLQNIFLNIWET